MTDSSESLGETPGSSVDQTSRRKTLRWEGHRLDHLALEVDDYEADFLESMLERYTMLICFISKVINGR